MHFKNIKFRNIIDTKNTAYNNISTDYALYSCYENDNKPIFRTYYWDNSYTTGASQDPNIQEFKNNFDKNYTKRFTGGGILFHGHDLSYSITIPTKLLQNLTVKQSYEYMCKFIISFYQKLGLKASFAKDNPNLNSFKNEFCQVGIEDYDIVINNHKIGGNAQKRTKKIIFQHGSIPLYKSTSNYYNPKQYGVSLEQLGVHISYSEAQNLLIDCFKQTFNVKLEKSHLTLNEIDKKKEYING